jgi:pyrimidine-nucleoside phosphorylase
MRMVDVILKKRNGGILTPEEVHFFIDGFVSGKVPDYQAAALMMAVYFKGMDRDETVSLVEAMLHSGDVIDLSSIHGVKVDKHSTGGVGDKTSLVVGPMVAAAGIPVPKMTGRGLGHTGGTIDKLESFAGFSIEMTSAQFLKQVNEIGIAFCGQTANLVPADKKLYALRDVTGTVENISLIAGSIMSKKLAGGADAIVLDVKTGSGAFMKTPEASFALAEEMVQIGLKMNKRMIALVTSMDQPLGYTIGNALEVKEAIDALRGEGPEDLLHLSLEVGAAMAVLAGKVTDMESGRALLLAKLKSGEALDKLAALIAAQGGDARQVRNPSLLPQAKMIHAVKAVNAGRVESIQAEAIGLAAMICGAGRSTKDDVIDHGAGIVLKKKAGDVCAVGETIAEVHSNRENCMVEAEEKILAAYHLSQDDRGKIPALILGRVDEKGQHHY